MKVKLQRSCNTQLKCVECGHQNFRICMEVNEKTNRMSKRIVNNVECSSCHALYQVELIRS